MNTEDKEAESIEGTEKKARSSAAARRRIKIGKMGKAFMKSSHEERIGRANGRGFRRNLC